MMLALAILIELISLVVLRYQPIRRRWRTRFASAWFWSAYAVLVWAFLSRFGARGSLDWRAGDAPWTLGLAVGALLMAYGMRWVQDRPRSRRAQLESALN